jgi:deoxycytidylate deaminase
MKIIIQKGIKTIHYLEDKYADTWQVKTSKKMAHHAKVAYFKHNFDKNSFNIAESFVKLICKR